MAVFLPHMNRSLRHIFNQKSAKGYRLLAVSLLIVLSLLSSCVVRKGIQAFFSTHILEHANSGKVTRSGTIYQNSLESLACTTLANVQNSAVLLVKPTAFGETMGQVLFVILPAFLISLAFLANGRLRPPVPYSWQRWTGIPLFLRYRLLLI